MRKPVPAFACFVIGLLLVFLIDANVARIIGVPLMLLGIWAGIAVVASPDFLEGDRE